MDLINPLCELENQRQPRTKPFQTYGRKKARWQSFQKIQQSIFAVEENEIANGLKSLQISQPNRTESVVADTAARKCTTNITRDIRKTKSDATSLRSANDLNLLLALSESKEIKRFSAFGNKLSKMFRIEKIGEGSFAEVFKIISVTTEQAQPHPVSSSINNAGSKPSQETNDLSIQVSNYTSIIKVIPLSHDNAPSNVLERCSTAASVAHEVNILKQLDPIHGFTRFRGLRIVKGSWPASFLSAHGDFRKRYRKRAVNASPDRDFGAEQIYALIEMDDAGSEISLIKRPNVFQAWDIFWISTILLANAEDCIKFEHRDLHMSNICVKSSLSQITDVVSYQMNKDCSESSIPKCKAACSRAAKQEDATPDIDPLFLASLQTTPETKIGLSNIRVTIIDYTVARAQLVEQSVTSLPKSTMQSITSCTETPSQYEVHSIKFEPLKFASDPFNSNTDDIEAYLQNLTYKKTRALAKIHKSLLSFLPSQSAGPETPSRKVCSPEQQEDKHSKWHAFIPRTNAIWLGYLLRTLIRRSRGRTGKLNIVKVKTSNKNKSNTKLITNLQESMWAILLQASQLINGDDYREIEDDNLPKLPAANETKTRSNNNNNTRDDNDADADADAADDDDDDNDNVDNEDDEEGYEPTWTEEELDSLPRSALDVLEIAVMNGWVSTGEIQAFRRILEDENS